MPRDLALSGILGRCDIVANERMTQSPLRATPVSPGRLNALWFAAVVILLTTRIVAPWTQPLGDPDFWWLWWDGHELLHGILPRLNTLSWTAPTTPWISHESGVAVIDALAGPNHLGLLRCLLLAVTWLVLAYIAWRPQGGRALPFALGWATLLITWGVSERALSWGNLMAAIVVALTTPARRLTGKEPLIGGGCLNLPPARLILATFCVWIWANLHGSFPVGIMLVGLADWRLGFLAALATLVNPYGAQIWGLLDKYQPGSDVDQFVTNTIPEWRPLSLNSLPDLRTAALLLVALPIIWPFRWRPVLLWAIIAAMACRHVRFTDIAAIVLLPWVSAGLARLLPPLAMPSPVKAGIAITALAALLLLPPKFAEAEYPADFPFQQLSGHRIWNEHHLGGFLGAHGVRVFWDSRNDCYPLTVLQDGSIIEWSDALRLPWLDRWHVDRVVAGSPHVLDPLQRAGWRDVGGAGDVRILARPGSLTGDQLPTMKSERRS